MYAHKSFASLGICLVIAGTAVLVFFAPVFGNLQTEAQAGVRFGAPSGIDLDVTYIHRAPLYNAYCVEYSYQPDQPGVPYLCAGTENDKRWPDPGEPVTYTAHIVNKGDTATPSAGYAWTLDGVEISSGMLLALEPAEETTVSLVHPWPHGLSGDGQRALGEHSIGFTVDPADTVAETYEINNSLEDPTNAMSFRISFTPEMYEAYNIPIEDIYPYSAEDWVQKQIAAMNASFANSIYPVTPNGATLRVRINSIEINPTDPGGAGAHDGSWFINDDYRIVSGSYDPNTDIDWAFIHELSHQVSLIDLYAIGASAPTTWVDDQNGNPANFGFTWSHPDLMGGGDISPHTDGNLYSSHSAGGASTYTGYRNGYYGSHQYDIPLNNYLRVLDSAGNVTEGVQVTLYQRTGPLDWSGNLGIDGTPEIDGVTNAEGVFHLPNRSAAGGTTTQNAHTLQDNPFGVVDVVGSQNLFLGRLSQGTHEEFFWLDITAFNLAYWQGDTISHTFEIQSHIPVTDAPASPIIETTRVQGDQVTVCWALIPGVTEYRVYRAFPPDFHYLSAGDPVPGPCFTENMPNPGWQDGDIYTIVSVDVQGRESGFSNFAWVKYLSQPHAVVIDPQGDRIVLDPQNGYTLLRQNSEGHYLQNIGSVHYHLEYTEFMNIDADQRLLLSHPGDWYEARHSVRVADRDGTPLFEFGQQGSGPGEFETPTGIASWGTACTIDQPYTVDNHTLLLLHFDGNYDGAQGEAGSASGTSFDTGRFGQGVRVDSDDLLTYPTADNLNRTQGSIEFWFKPDWVGGDELDHGFFEAGDAWSNRMGMLKDGANNLRFIMWDSMSEYGAGYGVQAWTAGEWHHVAATWQDSKITLYVDSAPVASEENANVPDFLQETMKIGTMDSHRAHGVIDELRISDIPRVGNSYTCNRILVADSGNHRLQAFDSLGNFLSAFGGEGSGAGQFNNPQGVAVDSQGRVIVVDSGNNRLVYLNFDGQEFTYLGSLSGGLFDNPTGVTVDSQGWIYVADTGNHRIVRISGTTATFFYAPIGGYTGALNAPRGVAVDSNGNIIVTDTGNQRVVTVTEWFLSYLPIVRR